jgi:hypothetical protein
MMRDTRWWYCIFKRWYFIEQGGEWEWDSVACCLEEGRRAITCLQTRIHSSLTSRWSNCFFQVHFIHCNDARMMARGDCFKRSHAVPCSECRSLLPFWIIFLQLMSSMHSIVVSRGGPQATTRSKQSLERASLIITIIMSLQSDGRTTFPPSSF